MTRFYLEVREDAKFFEDDEGSEFPGIDEVEQEALSAVVLMGKDRLPQCDTREVTVEVRDEDRNRVLTVAVKLVTDRVDSASFRS